MRKTYVLDTSVLINDPDSFKSFVRSNVIIPVFVLEELDKLKTQITQTGRNARVSIRNIDELSELGDISQGVEIEDDIVVKVDTSTVNSSLFGSDNQYNDNKILACAAKYHKESTDALVTLVSRDVNLRIRAKAFGINAEGYDKDNVKADDLFVGHRNICNEKLGEKLLLDGSVDASYEEVRDVFPNEFVSFYDSDDDVISIGRRVGNKIVKIKPHRPWGIETKNREQSMALDLLMDNSIPLVSLAGVAGSGKTLLCMAAALELVMEQKRYKKCMIYRPMQILGNDIGYLPGTVFEKISPHFGPILDSIDVLLDKKKGMFTMWMEKQLISFETIAFLRGRSIHDALIIVDETQNVSPHEMKAILTRAGYGTKIVLTGDYTQIDAKNLDATNNALTYVIEKFKKSYLAGSIILEKCQRSPLANEAVEYL